jgi:hypothetical protein
MTMAAVEILCKNVPSCQSKVAAWIFSGEKVKITHPIIP